MKGKARKKYVIWIVCLLAVLMSVAGILTAWYMRKTVITISADDCTMNQEEKIPEFTANISDKGNRKKLLEKSEKYLVSDLIKDLKEKKGYQISVDTDGRTEGEYEISIVLDEELEQKLKTDWKKKISIKVKPGTLTVKNKYGEWKGTQFQRKDGSLVMNDFVVSKEKTYYFDSDGNMVTGWQEIGGARYYFNQDGVMCIGWQEIDGKKYCFENDGKIHTGWLKDGENTYYFDDQGNMAVGDVKIGITMYSFDEEGVLTGEKTDIDPEKPMLALTFDDGPGERTMDLLNALEEYKAHATFFMCGTSLSRTDIDVDAILKKMDAIGCDTSDHTMTHPKLDTLTAEQVVQEVQGVSNMIAQHIGHGAVALRPPYGRGIHTDTVTQNVGLPMIYWSIDTLDWKTKSKDETVKAILEQAKDGDIVLLHDIHDWSVEAAIEVIPKLLEKGFQLVSVSELAAARGVTLENGVTYFNFHK